MIRTQVAPAVIEDPLEWRTMGEANGKTGSATLDGVTKYQEHPRHELLGSRVSESNEARLSWHSVVDLEKVPWLNEHVLLEQIVFPAAGYVAMAGESMRQIAQGELKSYTIKDLSISSAFILKPNRRIELRTNLQRLEEGRGPSQWYQMQITSYDGSHWIENCVSKVSPNRNLKSKNPDVFPLKDILPRRVARAYWYDVLESKGLKYGPAFQGLHNISTDPTENKAVATVSSHEDTAEYILHPTMIDQGLQILMVASCKGQGRSFSDLSVATAIGHLVVTKGGGSQTELKVAGTTRKSKSNGLKGDASVVSADGLPRLSIEDCEITVIPNDNQSSKDKIFSFLKWDTDVTHWDLNQAFAPRHPQPVLSIIIYTLRLLAHKNPKLKILELGSGSGETTHLLLNALTSKYGERHYLTYTYATTTFDATFKAKATFKQNSNVTVGFFDVEQSSQSQGFRSGSYDLIITTDFVSSASKSLAVRIEYLKQLIHPLGHLLLLDNIPHSSAFKDQSLSNHGHALLLENGFTFGDSDDRSSKAPKIIAHLKKPLKHPRKITLITPDNQDDIVNTVRSSFEGNDILCDSCSLEGNIPQGQDMISMVDFGEPYLYNITEARFRGFVDRLSSFKGSVIWVIPSSQISCDNPNSSMILGMARTLRAELRKDITVVEMPIDVGTFLSSSKALVNIYENLARRPKAGMVDPDYEYAIFDGVIKVPRMQWTTGREAFADHDERPTADDGSPQNLQSPSRGSLPATRFRSDATYLLVGGLGGLGRVVSTWMVGNGARNVLFLSRSAKESPENTPFFDELRAQGCEVTTFAGSVNDLSDVQSALKQATKPLAGVIQLSAVMRDNWMSHMTFSEWDQCVRPKVHGTWNLHQATSSANLDFFLLFSSICGLSGQWGQANYNSANAFLDAFAKYRHGQNLAASVVDIGFMGCVGMAVENKGLVQKLKTGGYYFLGEPELIEALTIAIANSHPGQDQFMNKSQLGLGLRSTKVITDPSTRVAWKKDTRMVLSHQLGSLGITTEDEAREYLSTAYQSQKVLE